MIIELNKQYEKDYIRLVRLLWKDISTTDLNDVIKEHYLNKTKIYISIRDDKAIGFVNLSVRNDYVEGCETNGVGYIEGIYVCEPYRRNKIAYQLIEEGIVFFKKLGLSEIGSDTEIENIMSQIFHKSIGFREVSTIKHYIMKI